MEFRSGRTAEIARSQLKEEARTDAIDLDRLAISLSISAGPAADDSGMLDAADGARHETHRIDRFGNREVFRPLLSALTGRELTAEGFRDELRRHINRGYDLLYRAFELSRKDWEATLERISPRLPAAGRAPGRSAAVQGIEIAVGKDARDSRPVTWSFNREGGGQTNSNVRIAGMPGVGKSQFLMHLLCSLGEQAADTGFILFDYKGDLAPNKEFLKATGARVIRPGDEAIPVNPFQLPANVNPALAPRAFAETFRTLSPRIGQVQEARLVRAMERCYANLRQPVADLGDNVLPWPLLAGDTLTVDREAPQPRTYPTLAEIVAEVEALYDEEGLPEDGVLATLRDLTRYNLFSDHSERPLPETFTVRWVIDLASLQALRNFFAFVVMEFLHQVARSLDDATFDPHGDRRQVRGIVAIDEAHYYLQAKCRPLLDLIRIGRSKGVPVFLSSQSLEDFRGHTEVNEFLPNTFVFRHGLPPDRRIAAGALHVPLTEAAQLAARCTSLEKFQALATLCSCGDDDEGQARTLALTGFWERHRPSKR
jgi:hypothetical protein